MRTTNTKRCERFILYFPKAAKRIGGSERRFAWHAQRSRISKCGISERCSNSVSGCGHSDGIFGSEEDQARDHRRYEKRVIAKSDLGQQCASVSQPARGSGSNFLWRFAIHSLWFHGSIRRGYDRNRNANELHSHFRRRFRVSAVLHCHLAIQSRVDAIYPEHVCDHDYSDSHQLETRSTGPAWAPRPFAGTQSAGTDRHR
jgi:hypothetical protein